MIYLIGQLWMLLIVGGLVGLACGWLMRGGSASTKAKHLERQLADAEAEAAEQRREATELAARLQSRAHGDAAGQVARLEQQLRNAQADANREAEAARDLRTRLEELESKGAASADSAEPLRQEVVRLNTRIGELEPAAIEAARLREQIAASTDAPADQPNVDRARLDELEAFVASLESGDVESYTQGAPDKRDYWMAARRRWVDREAEPGLEAPPRDAAAEREAAELRQRVSELEALLEEARAAAPAESDATAPLHERIAELEAALAAGPAPRADVDAAVGASETSDDAAAEIARLQWRNRYLDSRVRLFEKRAGAPAAVEGSSMADSAQPPGAPEENSLEWRNRYLASRVQHLENRLAEGGQGLTNGAAAKMEEDLRKARVEAADAAKLRARVAELERSLEQTRARAAGDPPPPEGEHALEWRNRYLSSRVKYLEERLTKLGGSATPDDVAPSADHGAEERST